MDNRPSRRLRHAVVARLRQKPIAKALAAVALGIALSAVSYDRVVGDTTTVSATGFYVAHLTDRALLSNPSISVGAPAGQAPVLRLDGASVTIGAPRTRCTPAVGAMLSFTVTSRSIRRGSDLGFIGFSGVSAPERLEVTGVLGHGPVQQPTILTAPVSVESSTYASGENMDMLATTALPPGVKLTIYTGGYIPAIAASAAAPSCSPVVPTLYDLTPAVPGYHRPPVGQLGGVTVGWAPEEWEAVQGDVGGAYNVAAAHLPCRWRSVAYWLASCGVSDHLWLMTPVGTSDNRARNLVVFSALLGTAIAIGLTGIVELVFAFGASAPAAITSAPPESSAPVAGDSRSEPEGSSA